MSQNDFYDRFHSDYDYMVQVNWNKKRITELKRMLDENTSRHEIARHFGVSPVALGKAITRTGLGKKLGPRKKSKKGNRKRWNEEDVQYLREKWGRESVEELAHHFDRSVSSINTKAWSLGCSERGTVSKPCAYCGKIFTPEHRGGYFCSPSCRRGSRIKRDKVFQFQLSFRNRVTAMIRRKRPMLNTAKLLGWNGDDFHDSFMEDQHYESWCQDGKAIHVDHIIPLSLYQLKGENDPDLIKAWNLRNLQLIKAKDNRDKKNKIPWELIRDRNLHDLLPEDYAIPDGEAS